MMGMNENSRIRDGGGSVRLFLTFVGAILGTTPVWCAISDADKNCSAEMNAASFGRSELRAPDGVRILFLGNSITFHRSAPQIGWTNDWGMAASAPDMDYVHLVTKGIEQRNGCSANVMVRNIAAFERDFKTWDIAKNLKDEIAFKPDYLVVALGENVAELVSDADRLLFRTRFKELIGAFMQGRRRPHAVVRGVFWPNAWKDAAMAHAASDYAVPFVGLDNAGLDESKMAVGLFEHRGVQRHPGDHGMRVIADRILEAFFPADSGYCVEVDGAPVRVMPIRVSRQSFNQWAPGYQRPVDQTEIAGLVRFEMDAPVRVNVRRRDLSSGADVIVRPLSSGVKPRLGRDGLISFDLSRPGNYVLEVGGWHRPLEMFAQPKRSFSAERESANIVFGPGVHHPVVVKLKSGDRVYVDSNAIVYGSLQADGAHDVRVCGYGIISGTRNRRDGNACYREGMDGAVRIIDSSAVVFDGPTILDSCCWCVSVFNSEDIELKNLKVTGAWRYNTDGIDVCNSRRIRVRDCYVHSFDDSLVVKGLSHDYVAMKKVLSLDFPKHEAVEDVVFSNCVCWCGWGRTLEVGFETWAAAFKGIRFESCDLIHNNQGALSVHLGGPAVVEDITFKNIRIECDGREDCPILQKNRNQKVECPIGHQIKWLVVENGKMFPPGGLYSQVAGSGFDHEPYGTFRKLVVSNVSISRTNGAPEPRMDIRHEPGSVLGDIFISDVALDGRVLYGSEHGKMQSEVEVP